MDNEKMHIYSGAEAANRLRNNEATLRELVLCLPRTRERIDDLIRRGQTDAETIVTQEKRDQVQKRFDKGNGIVLTLNGKIAAIADYERIGQWRERPIFEIGDVVTHPNHRSSGLSSPVRDSCMCEITTREPNALCLGCTKDPKLIAKYEEWTLQGFCEEIAGDVYEDIKSQGKGEPPLRDDQRAQAKEWYGGCRIFVVDLKKRFAEEKRRKDQPLS